MSKFEIVNKYITENNDNKISLPVRATAKSAGYDFEAAKTVIIPAYQINDLKQITKSMKLQPTLIPTGIKCKLDDGYYLELSVRSSTPLNNWIILANGVGIIDGDYYNNPDNEGEIFFQVINLSPVDIIINKGDKIGQGIIKKYEKVEGDEATNARTGGFGSTSQA